MQSLGKITTALAMLATSGAALADGRAQLYPIKVGAETVRYMRGLPTVDLETAGGGVLVTPLPADHGRPSFAVAVYNHTWQPANFGIESVSATIGGAAVAIFTKDQLVAKAKRRAFWTQVAVIAVAGVAAGVASTAHTSSHYRGTAVTPRGTYRWAGVVRDNSLGTVGAGAATAAGAATFVSVRDRLDYTIANLNDDIVQTTTIDPEATYGGRIVLDKPEGVADDDYDVQLTVHWNGADYPFAFRMGHPGDAPSLPLAAAPSAANAPRVMPAVISVPAGTAAPAAMPATVVTSAAPAPVAIAPQRALTPYELGRQQGYAALAARGD